MTLIVQQVNPDPIKQAQEVVFSQNTIKPSHPLIKFNNFPVQMLRHRTTLYDFR